MMTDDSNSKYCPQQKICRSRSVADIRQLLRVLARTWNAAAAVEKFFYFILYPLRQPFARIPARKHRRFEDPIGHRS